MTAGAFVRLSTILLTLSLVLGPVATNMHAASMISKAVPATLNGMQAPSNSIGCSGMKSGPLAKACSLDCAGMVAVASEVTTIDTVTAQPRPYHTLGLLVGVRFSPDPHPPKRVAFS
ncbi:MULTISPECIES: hypothetical protein [unclassified Bradyrhizobium]|uniref:hypothetical protein n=1 Tax=unclassified Bradyrhizobium TaxID=2631580 RepID=UPI002478A630|nr:MULTISPECIES: hypothetical protein [unclassified Bradyrhizobium]WGS21080.1 hypothetical protein MTX22_04745 [Bradyrhizobium sp. ISRA463]WGS27997.1 hypothetical protein MTX19_02595 [Bradyrhizobium sp. ISRA464]